jgi:hypothetical protein
MPRKRIHVDAAARTAAHRKNHDLVTLSVDISREVSEGLEAYMQFKGLTKAQVITKLIKTQLLRKR